METKIIKADKKSIQLAGKLLRNGEVVAIPTETVYGLGANALDVEAVRKIFEIKGRPFDNPLIVHVADKKDVEKYAYVSELARKIMDAFWPAPLTLILNKKDIIPDEITGGLGTVAIRMPNNKVAIDIIKEAGVPVAAPSANISGKPSPTTAKHVAFDLAGRIDFVIDGGECQVGLESTVLDLSSDKVTILRPGKISKKDLIPFTNVISADEDVDDKSVPKSPGMKYKHYAPKANVSIYSGKRIDVINAINKDASIYSFNGLKVGVIIEVEDSKDIVSENVYLIGSINDEEEVAKNLFAMLRKVDEDEIDEVLIPALSEENIGKATMNRLLKAANYNIKYV